MKKSANKAKSVTNAETEQSPKKKKKAPAELALPAGEKSTSTKPKKVKAEGSEKLDKANLEIAGGKVGAEKALKYIYPDEVTSSKQKKEFRRKMRSEVKGLNAKITRLDKSDKPEDKKALKEAKAELQELRTNHYTQQN